ncbi:hypothetical protein [Dapis sp. BLCC M229]|uniref:hypothetical protein n=1 Tax=Dapis sp. BLCC M229 TaxID=3400188 RepID=UPI003CFBC1B9
MNKNFCIGQLIVDKKGCLHEVAKIIYENDKPIAIITTFGGRFSVNEIEIVI